MAVPWRIKIDEPSTNILNWEESLSNATLTYIVPRDEIDIAARAFLGYSYRQDDTLRRVLPESHPLAHWLYAARVMVQGDVFLRGRVNAVGAYDEYDEYWLTVQYQTRPYAVRPDAYSDKEQHRFVQRRPTLSAEEVTLEDNAFSFDMADGAPTAAAIPQGIPLRVRRGGLHWTWYQVPHAWVFDQAGIAENIYSCLYTTNDALWEGFPAKTLLFLGAEFEETFLPVPPAFVGLVGEGNPPLVWNIHLVFGYFRQGWHRFPHPENRQFYRIVTASGDELFDTSDFDLIFQPVTDGAQMIGGIPP